MIQIIPAILATTDEEYSIFINKVNSSNLTGIDWVHIDFMDNKFVQNRSIDPEIISKYPTDSKVEAHLMVEDPVNWAFKLIKLNVKRMIAPVEIHYKEIDRFLDMLKDYEVEVGLSINPETSPEKIKPYLDQVNLVLIMDVHPGFQGQEFIPQTLEKVKEVLRLRSGQIRFKIEFDGGISEENIKQVADTGADIVVIGSGLFKYDNLGEGLEKIRRAASG